MRAHDARPPPKASRFCGAVCGIGQSRSENTGPGEYCGIGLIFVLLLRDIYVMAKKRRVNLADVAKAANTSISTVSRALRAKSGVGDEFAKRICELAERMGYRPDAAGRRLRTGRSYALGVLILDLPNAYYSQLLEGIHTTAMERGYSVYLQLAQQHGQLRKLWPEITDGRFDGLIMSQVRIDILEEINTCGIPVVLNGPYMDTKYDTVSMDYAHVVEKVVDHLVGLGHERIGFLCMPKSEREMPARLKGFREAIKRHGLRCREEWIISGIGTRRSGYAGMEEFIAMEERPTALVCLSDLVAVGAMSAIRRAGLEVPGGFLHRRLRIHGGG